MRTASYRFTAWDNDRQERELYLHERDPGECDNRAADENAQTLRTDAEQRLRGVKAPKPGPVNRARSLGPLQGTQR